MSRASPTSLTTRSDSKALPALDGSPAYQDLLDTEARQGAWRIVELSSRDSAPFEVDLRWSAGAGSGATVRVTVARACRISVFARTLRIRAANLSSTENRVGVTVADGFAATDNVYEVRGELEENAAQALAVPPFARSVRVELSDASLLSTAEVRILDGEGALRSATPLDKQPPDGVRLGGAGKVEVAAPSACAFRATYPLSL